AAPPFRRSRVPSRGRAGAGPGSGGRCGGAGRDGGVDPAGSAGARGAGRAGDLLLPPGHLLLRQGQGQCGEGAGGQQERGLQLAGAAGRAGAPGGGREGLSQHDLPGTEARFHHPILSPLESSFQLEVDVLAHLLKAQAQISEWKFLPSLVNLHSAHTKLQTWGQIFEKQRETKKHLFGGQSQKAVQPPHLFLWLMKLKNILLAKFSFYFHEALSRQTTASEMKTLTAKTNPDYFGKISSFIRKYDAVNVSLIFDNRGSESFQGHGYHHPHSYREAPKGVDQYPAVVSLPSDRPVMHWPNVIMIMTDRTSDLNSLEKVVHFYDDKVQSTYFLTRPEPHFTIVVIFESKKSERDYHFISFLNEISHSLKNSKAFASLKPGSKG
uniref:KICSTOR subunit 2 n=1 Tax=Zonotrichia albicollis TaxID=44394 RepID=A0A8D2MRH3_ZONAL